MNKDIIRAMRIKKGFSQDDMVFELRSRGRKISRPTYARIERGDAEVTVSDLVLIFGIFSEPVEKFFSSKYNKQVI
jgi:transcriptional regulator with XRE-family HTH domain